MIDIQPLVRHFLPVGLRIATVADIMPFADELAARPLETLADYRRFLADYSEFSAVTSETLATLYNTTSCHTADREAEQAYLHFVTEIEPLLAQVQDGFNRKIVSSPFAAQTDITGFDIALRGLRTSIELYRAANVPLKTETEVLAAESGKLRGARSITLDGIALTPQQAATRLFLPDRARREAAWWAINAAAQADAPQMDDIYDRLVNKRHQMALNAGFDNFRDYSFAALGRVDYGPADCQIFADAIRQTVLPLLAGIRQRRAEKLALDTLRPWDLAVDPDNAPPLKVFRDADDLIDKTKRILGNLHGDFAQTIQLMQDHGCLDLASRPNKRPGGYMNPMYASNIPFVFANVTETVRDMVTIMHEAGHAVQEIETARLPLTLLRQFPVEVAELASMAMELFTLDQWDVFFDDAADCKRAKRQHLENILLVFVSVAKIDAFQQEVYLRPEATPAQRHEMWMAIQHAFDDGIVDWSGLEAMRPTSWQETPHVFDLPFYYIEYAIAQMGALQLWRNYKQNPAKAVADYKTAIALGNTKSIPDIYATAGITFDFSAGLLSELMAFLQGELAELA